MTTDFATTMNRSPASANVAANDARVVAFSPSNRSRERDFGVGYGRSSGYADPRGYTSSADATRFFRVA